MILKPSKWFKIIKDFLLWWVNIKFFYNIYFIDYYINWHFPIWITGKNWCKTIFSKIWIIKMLLNTNFIVNKQFKITKVKIKIHFYFSSPIKICVLTIRIFITCFNSSILDYLKVYSLFILIKLVSKISILWIGFILIHEHRKTLKNSLRTISLKLI